MLCTFTTESGSLIIRSDDIRAIQDIPDARAMLHWEMAGEMHDEVIIGTASENAARIQQEELDMIGRVETHRQQLQQRMQAGYPATPVARGKQATK